MSAPDVIKFPINTVVVATEKFVVHVWKPGRAIEFSDYYPLECRDPIEARHRAEFIVDELNRWEADWQFTIYQELTDWSLRK